MSKAWGLSVGLYVVRLLAPFVNCKLGNLTRLYGISEGLNNFLIFRYNQLGRASMPGQLFTD